MNNFLHSPGRITICIRSGEYKKFFTRANIYSYSPGRIPIQIPIRSPIRIPNLRYPLGLRLTTPPYPFESSLSLLSFRVFLLPPLSSGVFLLPPYHVLFLSLRTFSFHDWGFDRASLDRDSVVFFTTTPSQPDLKDIYFWGYLSQFYYRKKKEKKKHNKLKYLY